MSSPKEKSQRCGHCNYVAAPNVRFCPKCGQKLDVGREATQEQEELNEILLGDRTTRTEDTFYYQRVLQQQDQRPTQTRTPLPPILPSNEYHYASITSRIFAYLTDQILLLLLTILLTNLIQTFPLANNADYSTYSETDVMELTEALSMYISLILIIKTLLGMIYFYLLESSARGQTIGMYLMRIRILDYRLNRTPSKQQVLVGVLSKAMELILLMDIILGRSTRNTPAGNGQTIDPELYKNQIRLSQRLARMIVVKM
jgi:uncharacterized RDD family membrane protein YckC